VAFEVADPALDEVERATRPWRDRFPKARWVPRENLHVTLAFMGKTYPRLLAWVRGRLEVTATVSDPVETHLTALGSFPSTTRGRVLWVGLADPEGQIAELAERVGASLAHEFPPQERAFTPHLTVARSDPPLRLPEGFAETPIEPVPFRVQRLVLFRSHLQRPAPRYEPLETFPLDG
jgi:2'-5' RNA ligase